ncbi:MAG: hypothetical protein K1X28_03475 [Parachlamydiales bacterium]|nr:hypothetical protein [Parachlamydiales bacterium]
MANVHFSSPYSLSAASLENQEYHPSLDEIINAKADLFSFMISEHAEAVLGRTLTEIKDFFLQVRAQYKIPEQRYHEVTGELFADMIDQAVVNGELDASVSRVFYGNIDRVAFIEGVITDFIACMIVRERIQPQPIHPHLIEETFQEIVAYFTSDGSRLLHAQSVIRSITEEASGNFDLAYGHKDPLMPSFATYFTARIREGIKTANLSAKVSDVYFSKSLDRKEFVRKLMAEILKSEVLHSH